MPRQASRARSEEHTSELQSPTNLVCRLLLEKNKYLSGGPPEPKLLLREVKSGKCPTLSAFVDPPLRSPISRSYTPAVNLLVPFFFNDAAPPEIYAFPPHGPL